MYETLHKYKLLGPLLKKTKKPFCKKIKNRMALGTSIDPVRLVSMVIGAQLMVEFIINFQDPNSTRAVTLAQRDTMAHNL
jgi:hypothetical protein